ncbi:hypothetical protein NQ318_007902 [Aromia moschata]|uniref:Transposase n=1 Tax=Aromia moschata TaxID=1265417 RepID=A0AAV8XUI5_9CUCU|nr:hypothetical protein NQ318_007902 [Aromia moschata]
MCDNIDRRLRETGTFYKTNRNSGRQRFATNVNVEKRVLNRIGEDPTLCARRLRNNVLGAVELPSNLNSVNYLDILRNGLQDLLDDVHLQDRVNMWFMQDGAAPHYVLLVRQWLKENYPGRWIGWGVEAPQFWPPHSPDLNPLDFYLWGERIYSRQVLNTDDLRDRNLVLYRALLNR